MLKTVELNSWEEFENEIKSLTERQIDNRIEIDSGMTVYTPFLFRGHPNSEWELTTTLERNVGENKSLNFYNNLIKQILYDLETFTNKKWDIEEISSRKLSYYSDIPDSVEHLLPLEYMSYLRHYGFPSPLLDWSYSPYIAAYFAFREMGNNAENVAIFEYHQIYNHMPEKRQRPIITPLWSLEGIRNNKRHFLQQSIYTVCINTDTEKPFFAHHNNVYATANEEEKFKYYGSAEFITKYILPASEREKALLNLEMYNINSFSLMGSDESLLETLFLRAITPYKAWRKQYPNARSALDD